MNFGHFDLTTFLIAGLGIYLVGLSKAGFGGGLGILTTPLAVIAFGRMHKEPVFAIGVVLPLLCARRICRSTSIQ